MRSSGIEFEPFLKLQLHHYWKSDFGWEWDKITPYLNLKVIQRIASFDVAPSGVEDTLYWTTHSSGKFNLKSALAIIRGEQCTQHTSI